jgi:hypothetical protein
MQLRWLDFTKSRVFGTASSSPYANLRRLADRESTQW